MLLQYAKGLGKTVLEAKLLNVRLEERCRIRAMIFVVCSRLVHPDCQMERSRAKIYTPLLQTLVNEDRDFARLSTKKCKNIPHQ